MKTKLKLVVNNKILKKEKFFIKKELQSILNLYARKVSSGDWKDYGLSINKKEITFDYVEINQALEYAAEDALVTLKLYNLLNNRIKNEKSRIKIFVYFILSLTILKFHSYLFYQLDQ